MAFAHLHVHTTYSICDGVARIGELFRRAKELKQSGLAITDHEVLSGVPTFLSVAKEYPSKNIRVLNLLSDARYI